MNTAAIRAAWAGRVIDERFTLLEWLGGSETSAVFRTELPGQPFRQAAIKLITADSTEAEARIAAWEAATDLSHPHLMRLIECGRCQVDGDALVYVVMEYAEENLAQVLPERPLTPSEAAEMMDPVLDALSYLHGKGLVHGHLKPKKIMVVENQVKISSDGLHRAGEPGRHSAASGIYDAPEAAAGRISPASDIWALGVTLVEALAQHPPLWDRPAQGDPVIPESIPPPLAGIARECLRSDPARRCTLAEIKARLHPQAAVPAAVPTKAAPARRSWLRGTVAITSLVVMLALAAGLLLRFRAAQPGSTAGKKLELSQSAAPEQAQASAAESPGGDTIKGAVAARVMPQILPAATESIHGQFEVVVRVRVNTEGAVTGTDLDAPGPSKYFAKQALQAAQQWRFKPAQTGGKTVASHWLLDFRFTRASTEVVPVETEP